MNINVDISSELPPGVANIEHVNDLPQSIIIWHTIVICYVLWYIIIFLVIFSNWLNSWPDRQQNLYHAIQLVSWN